MSKLRVVIAKVAFWPGSDAVDPCVVVFAPFGVLPTAEVRSGTTPLEVALDVSSLASPAIEDVESNLEPVMFDEMPDGSVDLIYTAAVLPTAMLVDENGEPVSDPSMRGWQDLQSKTLTGETKKVVARVRDYWRSELAETTAVFDFLPKYFTTTQGREVYSSIWETPQDPGNFHRWLHKQNDGICNQTATKDEVLAEREEAMTQTVARTANLSLSIAKAVVAGMSTLRGGTGLAPLVVLSAAVAAGGVLLSIKQQRGPEPLYYSRTSPNRENLTTTYGPRPA